ncbi:MAG: hypothetical protein ABFC84_16680 [Veillonellales bacterium]
MRDNKITKVGGTTRYNPTALTNKIPYVKRSYHKRGDGTFVKRTICFSNGSFYSGNDVTGALTLAQGGFPTNAIPTDLTFQVSGNSILYSFTGLETPYKYDGNGSYTFERTTLDADIMAAVEHLDRVFYIKNNSSDLDYSEEITPETIEDTILIGNAQDSINIAVVKGANDTIYIFKNNSIYELLGRTPSSFQARCITTKYGLASKRAICAVGSGFIFLNEFDKELYFFGGSESSIMNLTEADIRLREIIDTTYDSIESVCMAVHNGLFRFAFKHRESPIDSNNCELIYCITEPQADGKPKWSLVKGSNVLSYAVMNQQGDSNELLTGRSDIGCLMYHNRGWDFDSTAIETIVRTAEVVVSEDMVHDFLDFFIKAKPGHYSLNAIFKYFLNGRYSIGASSNLSVRGETRDVGSIHLSNSSLLNDRIVPLCNYRRGNSISFEIYENNGGTELEFYSIAFKSLPKYIIRNQYV